MSAPVRYPAAPRSDVVDVYHGTAVPDPYRSLEDTDAPATRVWIDAENRLTRAFLDAVPELPALRTRLTKLWNYERFSLPQRVGGRYFFLRNDGLQNQSVLYVAAALDGEARVLLDPNGLSTDGTVALQSFSVSEDGRLLAYALAAAGSDWLEWRVRDVDTGTDRDDVVKWSKFSGASWSHDGAGFFYSRYDEPTPGAALEEANYFHKLCYHRLGTAQSDDTLVYERKDEREWGFGGAVTDDGRYLIITVWKGTDPRNLVFYRDLRDPSSPVVELITGFDAEYTFIGNDGPLFVFKTDRDAPRGRIISVDTGAPGRDRWRELVGQNEDTLVGAGLLRDKLILDYLSHAQSRVRLHASDGRFLSELALPGIGTISGFGGRRTDEETFYAFTSFNTPATLYRYDVVAGASTLWRRPKVDLDPDDYETRQVFVTSKDGTRVPMFISHKKGLVLEGKNPTYLYGYGGFNISLTPWFSVSNLAWMELGGVFSVANLRGGGEYGEEWHRAGTGLKKQNVFDDFMAAAQWLVGERYTAPEHLGIGGASNGGLLVGACLTQRPELFGAVVAEVGVHDMLRFHKYTIGWAWTDDYGSSDDAEAFRALLAYSPVHNVRKGTRYPATLIMTGDHDDRVVPAHSFKLAAALQEAQAGDAPILVRIETRAGHGAGKPTAMLIDAEVDRWAFLRRILTATT